MTFNKKENATTKINDFEPAGLVITDLKDTDDGKNNSIGWANYKHKTLGERATKLKLQLDWKYMHTYGVPKVGEFYPNDQKRANFKFPLVEEEVTFTKMAELDAHMGSDAMKQKLFPGKKLDKYEYIPVLKISEDADVNRPPYIKVRLNTTWPDVSIKSEVFLTKTEEINGVKKIQGTPEKMEVTTLDDFTTYVKYKSTIRPIIEISKVWADTKPKSGGTKLKYGIVWRLVKILVDDNGTSGESMDNTNTDFIDDDDDNYSKPTAIKTPVVAKEEEEDDEEEEEVIVKPPTKTSKKVVVEEEDDEEEEVVKPPPKQPAKKVVEEEEDDDEEEEEVVPVKKTKAKVADKKKK